LIQGEQGEEEYISNCIMRFVISNTRGKTTEKISAPVLQGGYGWSHLQPPDKALQELHLHRGKPTS